MKRIIAALLLLATVLSLAACSAPGEPACKHDFVMGQCAKCEQPCAHDYKNSICTVCGASCDHDFSSVTSKCSVCGYICTDHLFKNDDCVVCGFKCDHKDGCCYQESKCEHVVHAYSDGKCRYCNATCPHPTYQDGRCALCNKKCEHDMYYKNCKNCDFTCEHLGLTAEGCLNCTLVCHHYFDADYKCSKCANYCKHSMAVNNQCNACLFDFFADFDGKRYAIVNYALVWEDDVTEEQKQAFADNFLDMTPDEALAHYNKQFKERMEATAEMLGTEVYASDLVLERRDDGDYITFYMNKKRDREYRILLSGVKDNISVFREQYGNSYYYFEGNSLWMYDSYSDAYDGITVKVVYRQK